MVQDEEPEPEIVGQTTHFAVVHGARGLSRAEVRALRARGLAPRPGVTWWPPAYARNMAGVMGLLAERAAVTGVGRREVSVVPLPPRRPGWWRRWTAAALRRHFASADLRQDEREGWVVDVRLSKP